MATDRSGDRVAQLAALAHPQRLALFRLLVRRFPDAVPAGEIAAALDVRQNTLSSYLNDLRHAGLIAQHRQGRSLLYRVEMAESGGLVDYLVSDCGRGRPDLCAPGSPAAASLPDRPRVLFVCAGNSARSIIAESLLRHEAGDRFAAFSAGTRARSEIHPQTRALLTRKGHDLAPLRAKTVAELRAPGQAQFDFVFTVCDRAANEDLPPWPGRPLSAHWGLPDPVPAEGAADPDAFDATFDTLKSRIDSFAALPVHRMDRAALQSRLDAIALEI